MRERGVPEHASATVDGEWQRASKQQLQRPAGTHTPMDDGNPRKTHCTLAGRSAKASVRASLLKPFRSTSRSMSSAAICAAASAWEARASMTVKCSASASICSRTAEPSEGVRAYTKTSNRLASCSPNTCRKWCATGCSKKSAETYPIRTRRPACCAIAPPTASARTAPAIDTPPARALVATWAALALKISRRSVGGSSAMSVKMALTAGRSPFSICARVIRMTCAAARRR